MSSASIPTRSTPQPSRELGATSLVGLAAVFLVALIVIVAVRLGPGAPRDVIAFVAAVLALVLLAAGAGTGRLILAGAMIGLIRLALGSP